MYTESQIYIKNTFICGWTTKILAKSSKIREVSYFKFLLQPNQTKNKEMGAKIKKNPHHFEQRTFVGKGSKLMRAFRKLSDSRFTLAL
jgi:hypothetical protein